jgi:hypothetical protein
MFCTAIQNNYQHVDSVNLSYMCVLKFRLLGDKAAYSRSYVALPHMQLQPSEHKTMLLNVEA